MGRLTNEKLVEINSGGMCRVTERWDMAAEILELREAAAALKQSRPQSIVDCVLEAQAAADYGSTLIRIAAALEGLLEEVKLGNLG